MRFAVTLCTGLLQLVPVAYGVELGGWGSLAGSYRNILFTAKKADGHNATTDYNRLRLNLAARKDHLSAHIEYDNELYYGGAVPTPAFQLAANQPQPTWLDADATIAQRGHLFWRHNLYRGWVQYETDALKVAAGRQRIAWGTGRIWRPTDRFNPVDPTSLQTDQKLGVDTLLGEYRASRFGAMQIVAAPGSGAHGASRKVAARWRDTIGESDYALLAGRIGTERVVGADFSANVGEGGLYGELMLADSVQQSSYMQADTGYEYTLTNTWFPSGLYLLAEYFFNGAASRSASATDPDRLNSIVKHQFGLSAGYDLTPLWRIEGTVIADPVKKSAFVSPQLTWSVTENVELRGFALWFNGKSGSEYGGRSNVYALQMDAYF